MQRLKERQKRLQEELLILAQHKIKTLMAEKTRQANLAPMQVRTKQELKKLVPLIKEAN